VSASPANQEPAGVLHPFQYGARSQPQPAAHLGWHRNLALCRELRSRERHADTLPG